MYSRFRFKKFRQTLINQQKLYRLGKMKSGNKIEIFVYKQSINKLDPYVVTLIHRTSIFCK